MGVELFEQCIGYISRNYRVVLFEEFVKSGEYQKYRGEKIASIMFDDGYKDNIEFAAPILKKHGVKASFYVVTDCIDHNRPTWTHTLEYRFQHTRIENLELDFHFLPNDLRVSRPANQSERIIYVKRLKPFLKTLDHELREIVLRKIDETYNDVGIPSLMMNWEDLKQLQAEGHYIGSHTRTHCMLGTMQHEDKILDELITSAKRIREMTGRFPESISYPVGSFNQRTKELALRAGYSIGLAVKQNVHQPQKEDLMEVSRIELYNESWWKTWLRMTNLLENIKSLIRYR